MLVLLKDDVALDIILDRLTQCRSAVSNLEKKVSDWLIVIAMVTTEINRIQNVSNAQCAAFVCFFVASFHDFSLVFNPRHQWCFVLPAYVC